MASFAQPAPETFRSVETLLGGRGVLRARPHTALHWIDVIRHGIPAAAVQSLLKAMQVSQSELAKALGIPERTVARRKPEGALNSEESGQLQSPGGSVGPANAAL